MLWEVWDGTSIVPDEVDATYMVPVPPDIEVDAVHEQLPDVMPVNVMVVVVEDCVTLLNVTLQDVPNARAHQPICPEEKVDNN